MSSTGMSPTVQRGLGYPFRRPLRSFVYVRGQVFYFDLKHWDWTGPPSWKSLLKLPVLKENLDDSESSDATSTSLQDVLQTERIEAPAPKAEIWTGILAIGSNSSPDQLKRKFPPDVYPDAVIPVTECVLKDMDIVYAPLVSSYGSLVATLQYSPGTTVQTFVTWLLPQLLTRMNATEGGYDLHRFENATATLKNGITLSPVLAYTCKWGVLGLPTGKAGERGCVGLKEITAEGRTNEPLTQIDAQKQLCTDLCAAQGCPTEELEQFVTKNVEDDQRRKRWNTIMQEQWATKLTYPSLTMLTACDLEHYLHIPDDASETDGK
eukprot:TRINITY_DN38277_c0_g1_i1.p1 TRINITY_DN38277_c0_g1~~TRINITY_DN38277_c0_g1_i1.p1  ORF type:complete len:322 (-),score=18.91 TRINITY_DN38277_c0_g1_i1:172-1137(-)